MSSSSVSNHHPLERRKNHPPNRLQHYPSLPNIWIPPHSAPMPTEKPGNIDKVVGSPSAPSSPKSSPKVSMEEEQVPQQKRHAKNASIGTVLKRTNNNLKTHTRRRTERDQPHNLLTPPLTPSSSIRTTDTSDVQPKTESEVGSLKQESRILAVGNVNRLLSTNPPTTVDRVSEVQNDAMPMGPPGFFSEIRRRFEGMSLEDVATDVKQDNCGTVRVPASPHFFYHTAGSNTLPNPNPNEYPEALISPCAPLQDGRTCIYCPSGSSHVGGPPMSFFPRVSPGPGPMFYAPHQPPISMSPNMHGLPPPLHPPPSMMPWPTDPAIAAMSGPMPGSGPFHYAPNPINPPNLFYPPDFPNLTASPYQHPLSYPILPEHFPDTNTAPQHTVKPQRSIPSFAPRQGPSSESTRPHVSASPPAQTNQLNLAKIGNGGDTRTTVMIKNIPNKMSDKDLENFISKVCPRQIDFLYLRIDFSNGCNVGYAFVNFISVESLLAFATERLGTKWNMFSSEKVLQMTYANYQGKEACIEKFKNSCIMDERPDWRPRIYYSSGPNQGLPEAFPPPTHIRRKERSSHNRGALFVPSANGALFHGGNGRRGPWPGQNRSSRRDGL